MASDRGWFIRPAALGRGGRGRSSVLVRVLMPVAATVSAAPRAPEDEAEQEEPDQEEPEQAEEREESEAKAVIARVDDPAVAARRRDDLGRLAGVVGDKSHDRGDRDRPQPQIHAKRRFIVEPPFVVSGSSFPTVVKAL